MSPARPVIGLSAYSEHARWGEAWSMPATLLPQAYADAVAAAGALPLLIPSVTGVAAIVDRVDALILAGGGDIDPARYGASPDAETAGVRPERDGAESELLAAALERGTPVLGICRGMQLLNVARGGTLHQHLPDVVGHSGHRSEVAVFGPHDVKVAPDSLTARALGETALSVPSYHHQAVDRLGRDVIATAWCDDGTVEAVEYTDRPDVLGVQWHPEMGADPRLLAWFTERARVSALDHR
ncbi:gamma-glutamyl-gamma-aminobutyrate hydrolase family protein [Nocardiopsis ansamitocini]|uniref:Gamma-glutamyl-gamma-aminobutyrate hydrolase n=1 Tax=Nocardiopsis ansamitocini TaxID=1670832 RepID=A0A9W6UHM6_9ACTN|nr:gamma-glutamyl-gamma-aminobutyrate hydrolase family protein [Nocardiopsis ansamitocini]GLU46145.1 gamma-glutamyl-gamma-aminobutyrate hydrolase [Nocardiopsis ansamitocini]